MHATIEGRQPSDTEHRSWLSNRLWESPEVLADDFECTDPLPIGAVRWRGTYFTSAVRPDGWATFHISFHLSLGQHPYSLPGPMVAFYDQVRAEEVFTGLYDSLGHAVYRCDAYLPQWFDQYYYSQLSDIPGELWIDICQPSHVDEWCWSETAGNYLDYSVYAETHNGPWFSWDVGPDMAFEIMTIPEPATMDLFGLGVAGLIARRRRAR